MTTVLIAIDESAESQHAAETAVRCFGPEATYVAIYVDEAPAIPAEARWAPAMEWGGVYGYPGFHPYAFATDLDSREDPRENVDQAEREAARLASDVGISAEAVGDVGDPVSAIVRAANEHGADVIVVGRHQRGWFSKLIEGSTSDDLLKASAVPVFVVPEPDADS